MSQEMGGSVVRRPKADSEFGFMRKADDDKPSRKIEQQRNEVAKF